MKTDAAEAATHNASSASCLAFLSGKTYYRFSQVFAVLIIPAVAVSLFYVRIEDMIRSRGLVESTEQVVVRSPVKDTLVKTVRKEGGDAVEAGEVVVEFEDVAGIRNRVRQIGVDLLELKDRFARFKALAAEGGYPKADLKKLEYKITRMRLERDALQERADRLRVQSPVAGQIINVSVRAYDKAEIGRELFSVSGETTKIIRCRVPEKHFVYLREGQAVHIKSEVYNYLNYEVYRGTVESVSPFGTQEGEAILFDVTVRISGRANRLMVGSSALCEIVTEEKTLVDLLFPRR